MGAESVLSNLGQAYRRGRFELKNGEIQPHFAHSPKIIRVSPRGAPACAQIRLGWPHSGLGGLSDGFAQQLRASVQSSELKTLEGAGPKSVRVRCAGPPGGGHRVWPIQRRIKHRLKSATK